jgi:hypothetical protein
MKHVAHERVVALLLVDYDYINGPRPHEVECAETIAGQRVVILPRRRMQRDKCGSLLAQHGRGASVAVAVESDCTEPVDVGPHRPTPVVRRLEPRIRNSHAPAIPKRDTSHTMRTHTHWMQHASGTHGIANFGSRFAAFRNASLCRAACAGVATAASSDQNVAGVTTLTHSRLEGSRSQNTPSCSDQSQSIIALAVASAFSCQSTTSADGRPSARAIHASMSWSTLNQAFKSTASTVPLSHRGDVSQPLWRMREPHTAA